MATSAARRRADPIAAVESCYELGGSQQHWLSGVVSASEHLINQGLGVAAYCYDFGGPTDRIAAVAARGVPDGWVRSAVEAHLVMPRADRLRLYRSGPCITTSEIFEASTTRYVSSDAMRSTFGTEDFLVLVAANPDDTGCAVVAPASHKLRLRPAKRTRWTRVAAHVAAGLRLRRCAHELTNVADRAEAVLTPSGTIEHAEGDARERNARDALRAAALSIGAARGRLRNDDSARALSLWQGLVSGRWTLIDHFDSDGRRHLLALRNESPARELAGLSTLERQVIGLLSISHSYKLVAYELGVSVASVGRAVQSACRKLGLRNRLELARLMRSPDRVSQASY
jgi:DNA-binding CsgD family transcriptional regulator